MARSITVARLREILNQLPSDMDGAVVVVPAKEHTYVPVRAFSETSALYEMRTGVFTQDFGEEVTKEADYGKRLHVLLVE